MYFLFWRTYFFDGFTVVIQSPFLEILRFALNDIIESTVISSVVERSPSLWYEQEYTRKQYTFSPQQNSP